MTYLNTTNSRRNPLGWPSRFGSFEKQFDSIFAGFPSLFDFQELSGDFANDSTVKVRWYEKDDGYLARLDLPGVRKEDISLELEDGYLRVSASRTFEPAEKGDAAFEYRKNFKVPDEVEVTGIAATYEDGVLSLKLPKGEKAKPRQIRVS